MYPKIDCSQLFYLLFLYVAVTLIVVLYNYCIANFFQEVKDEKKFNIFYSAVVCFVSLTLSPLILSSFGNSYLDDFLTKPSEFTTYQLVQLVAFLIVISLGGYKFITNVFDSLTLRNFYQITQDKIKQLEEIDKQIEEKQVEQDLSVQNHQLTDKSVLSLLQTLKDNDGSSVKVLFSNFEQPKLDALSKLQYIQINRTDNNAYFCSITRQGIILFDKLIKEKKS